MLAGAACTDPTAIGPVPEFVRLTRISSFDGIDGPEDSTPLPADSCPTIPGAPSGWQRRALGDEPATIALPVQMRGATAAFSGSPGIVFNDPDVGFIAIAYGDEQPVLARSASSSTRVSISSFSRTCSLTVNGRALALRFSFTIRDVKPGVRRVVLDPLMIIRLSSPSGRRINSLVALHDGVTLSFGDDGTATRSVIALATSLTSLQW